MKCEKCLHYVLVHLTDRSMEIVLCCIESTRWRHLRLVKHDCSSMTKIQGIKRFSLTVIRRVVEKLYVTVSGVWLRYVSKVTIKIKVYLYVV